MNYRLLGLSLSTIILVLMSSALAAGETASIDWRATYGGTAQSSGDRATRVLPAPGGDVYMAGTIWDLDEGPPETEVAKILVARYTSDGTLVWDRRLADEAGGLAVDAALDGDGNLVVLGTSAVDGSSATFLAKLSPSGDVLWTRTNRGDSKIPGLLATALAVGPDDAIYALGFEFIGSLLQGLAIKYEADGSVAWSLDDATMTDLSPTSAVADDTGLYFAGLDFRTDHDVLVARITPAGSIDWTTSLGADGEDGANDLAFDGEGRLVAAGFFQSETQDRNVALAKLETDGSVMWTRSIDGGDGLFDEGTALAIDSRDRIAVAGTSLSAPDAGGGFLAVYGSDGALRWSNRLDSPADTIWNDVVFGAAGQVYVTGSALPNDFRLVLVAARYGSGGVEEWLHEEPTGTGDGSEGEAIAFIDGRAVVGGAIVPVGGDDDLDAAAIAFSSAIFRDGFESGDTSAWSGP